MWPPVMWPVSCAMTPITSLGVLACISVPVWMKTLRAIEHEGVEGVVLTMRILMSARAEPGRAKIGLA